MYTKALSESTVASTNTLVLLTCTDADTDFGTLNYMITSVTSAGALVTNPFNIDGSGAIRLNAMVDYETDQLFTVLVTVSDNGSPTRAVTATVQFEVLNSNDNIPDFNSPSTTVNVIENTAVGTNITSVKATDLDVDDSITYSIVPSIDEFEIDPRYGDIYLRKQVNYDGTVKSYEIVVFATDDGTPAKTGSTTVTVSVLNFNDGTPEFNPGVYVASLPENSLNSYTVLSVSVDDIDDTSFTYAIDSGNTDGIFQIFGTTNTAEISVLDSANLDYEKTKVYELVVRAADSGGLSGTATVVIEVTNINEYPPAFNNTPSFTQFLPENSGVRTSVLEIDANDADDGIDGIIKFSIISGASGRFAINPNTGLVTVSGTLDIESVPSYTIVVKATDGGTSPSKSGCCLGAV